MEFVVKDIIVIFRKIKTILILISLKRYLSHPKKSILNLSLIPDPDDYTILSGMNFGVYRNRNFK